MNATQKGAFAGAIATIFHTAVMLALHPRLPRTRRYPLPPVEITSVAAARASMEQLQSGDPLTAATVVSHFGFGAAAGAIYAPLAERLGPPSVLTGIGYGLGVWAVSYLGWLPALRMRRGIRYSATP